MKDTGIHIIIAIVVIAIIIGIYSFSGQYRAKNLGGSMTISLKKDERLINVNWKEDGNLWILTKEDNSTKPSIYKFQESSKWGIMEGTITIKEQ